MGQNQAKLESYVRNNDVDNARLLLEWKADYLLKCCCLHEAARLNHVEMLAFLLEFSLTDPRLGFAIFEKDEVTGLDALGFAIYHEKPEAALLLAQHENSTGFKTFLAECGDSKRYTYLAPSLTHDKNLRAAVTKGMLLVVQELLVRGADPNSRGDACRTTMNHPDNRSSRKASIEAEGVFASMEVAIQAQDADAVGDTLASIFDTDDMGLLELLLAKEDLSAQDDAGSTAMDLVGERSDRQEFIDAIKPFTSMEAALTAQHADAVGNILARVLRTEGLSEAVALRSSVVRRLAQEPNASTEWKESLEIAMTRFKQSYEEPYRKNGLMSDSEDMRPLCEKKYLQEEFYFNMVLLGDLDHVKDVHKSKTIGLKWNEVVFGPRKWTALHVAAAGGHFEMVQYLLQDCGVNPTAATSHGEIAVQFVYEGDDKDGKLRYVLKKHGFQVASTRILTKSKDAPVTESDLRQLLGQLTSVQDLRILFALGIASLTQDEMRSILHDTFDEVITEKLVFDTSAAGFFIAALNACQRRGLLSEQEASTWTVRALHVSVEGASWVREIKRSLQQLECRVTNAETNINALHKYFNALREALVQKERNDTMRAKRERLIGIVSASLALVGGFVIGEVLGAVLDSCEMAQSLLKLTGLSEKELEDFISGKPTKIAIKTSVTKILEDSSIDPVTFVEVLRDEINLQRVERACDGKKKIELLPASQSNSTHTTNATPDPPIKRGMRRFQDVVRRLQAQAAAAKSQKEAADGTHRAAASTSPKRASPKAIANDTIASPNSAAAAAASIKPAPPTVDHSWISEAELEEKYPYHCAVRHSKGDLEDFKQLVSWCIDEANSNINKAMQMRVQVDEAGASESVNASPLVYASHLGFLDIVCYFLNHKSVVLEASESKFSVVSCAQRNAKKLQAVCST